ncbi:prolyl oligopeptidase family serine peptidase [Aeoliella sp.]|uniref:prolyl oligopeptidase family serine peptidase n=1 Tax=Aeoliella sp. TaxID=2795800 RepID=UPI003CCB7C47
MPIEFTCPSCGKAYRVKDELAGRSATCKCGERLSIPELLEDNALAPDSPPLVSMPETFVLAEDNPYLNPDRFRGRPLHVRLAVGSLAIAALLLATVLGLDPFDWLDKPKSAPQVVQEVPPPFKRSLQEQRGGFFTELTPHSFTPTGPATDPPRDVMRKVYYESPAGELVAYLTPPPRNEQRLPAIVWVHNGYGGIQPWLWKSMAPQDDRTVKSFLDKDMVVMCPSLRSENDNPGKFEFLFGEVEDLIAAGNYVASIPYVDPTRVYVAGLSEGGTLAMLAAASDSPFRAAFVFGGDTDFEARVRSGNYKELPFDRNRLEEVELRAPENFALAIRIPTFYFDGSDSIHAESAQRVARRARADGAPLHAAIIDGGNRYDILRPLKDFIADAILEDTGEACTISVTPEQANHIYSDYWQGYKQREQRFLEQLPPVEPTPIAALKLAESLEEQNVRDGAAGIMLRYENGDLEGFRCGLIENPSAYESFVVRFELLL